MKKKNKIIITLSIIMLITLLFILGIFFYNNYNKIIVYQFDDESEILVLLEGSIIYSNNGNVFDIGLFFLKNDSKVDIEKLQDAQLEIHFDNMG